MSSMIGYFPYVGIFGYRPQPATAHVSCAVVLGCGAKTNATLSLAFIFVASPLFFFFLTTASPLVVAKANGSVEPNNP
jgi:hypothetical protein